MAKYPVKLLIIKVVELVSGLALLALGIHSWYMSQWVKKGTIGNFRFTLNDKTLPTRPYQLCSLLDVYREATPWENVPNCPSIALEVFFLVTIIASYALVALTFTLGCVIKINKDHWIYTMVQLFNRQHEGKFGMIGDWRWAQNYLLNYIDLVVHILSSLLVLMGSICYMVSATQIWSLDIVYPIQYINGSIGELFLEEKWAAGGLGIIQSIIYSITIITLYKVVEKP